MRLALAPDIVDGDAAPRLWEHRSPVSGGDNLPRCCACDERIRGDHTRGPKHARNVLRTHGDVLSPGTSFLCEVPLPAGTPKQIDVNASLRLDAWLTTQPSAYTLGVVVAELDEDGVLYKFSEAAL